jgi:hypothetical protein
VSRPHRWTAPTPVGRAKPAPPTRPTVKAKQVQERITPTGIRPVEDLNRVKGRL